jgi:antitoxin component YwqK of YwqJK toxin-antitoxin module
METESFFTDKSGKKVLHGPQIWWAGPNRKRREVNYVDGEKEGQFTEWDAVLGFKSREGAYSKGEPVGRWTELGYLGQLLAESFYDKGTPVGSWTEWHYSEKGEPKKKSRCVYKDGHIDGMKVYWNETGAVIKQERYDGAGHLCEATGWYENGHKWYHGTFAIVKAEDLQGCLQGPPKHGVWTYWDREEKRIAQGTWKDGKPWDGVCGIPKLSLIDPEAGIDQFGRYKNGELIEHVPHPGGR